MIVALRSRAASALLLASAALVSLPGCDDGASATSTSAGGAASASASTAVSSTSGSTDTSSSSGTGGAPDPGPDVDLTDPQLYAVDLTADEADPAATKALGIEPAFLDTRVAPRGELVVFLHGAGTPAVCGSKAHEEVLAGFGFHVFAPCYVSDYGVGNCGADIEGCRLEAFEGVDHTSVIDIAPADSVETRIVKGLLHLAVVNPAGDWGWFVERGAPRWDRIVVSGISHGASSSGVIGVHRAALRVVMLSGPLDSGQAWLKKAPLTPIDRFFGFTHTADPQHAGHLQSFEDMGLPGVPAAVDGASPPYGGSHRLVTSAPTSDGHSSLQAGGSSPKAGDGSYAFLPVWRALYGVPE